jgi:hypothetical protein
VGDAPGHRRRSRSVARMSSRRTPAGRQATRAW